WTQASTATWCLSTMLEHSSSSIARRCSWFNSLGKAISNPGLPWSFFGFPVVQLRSRVFPGFLNALGRLRVNKFLCIPHQFFGCSHVLFLHVRNRYFRLPDRQSKQWRNALLIVLRF